MLFIPVFAQKKVAVYVTGNDPVNEIIGNRLVDGLAKNGKYIAVERSASFLKSLSKEHNYERNGAVDDNQIAELGRQFGVQYVCVASVLNVWRNEKYITARIIDAESAEVVASGSSNGSITSNTELLNAMNSLSESLLKTLDYNKTSDAKKVAVYVAKTGNNDVDIILGDQLVAGFARSGKYIAIERTNSFLSQLSKEQGYQQSGAVDDDDLTRLGKQFGVQYVCAAKTTFWDGSYYISSRLIDVTSAEIINSYNAENKKMNNSQSVIDVATEIAGKLSGNTIKEENQRLADNPWIALLNKVPARIKWDNGNRFWGDDKYGICLWNNGEMYCGEFDNWKMSGWGMYIMSTGNNLPNCPDSWAYVGPWKDGKRHGNNGTVYDKDGKILYRGKFKDDKPVGEYPKRDEKSLSNFSIVQLKDGGIYIGERRYTRWEGVGLIILENGIAWYGEFKNQKRDGKGIFLYSNGKNNYKIEKYSNNNLLESTDY